MRACERCRAEFTSGPPSKRYCSDRCARRAHEARRLKRKALQRSPAVQSFVCAHCGEGFQRAAVRGPRPKFCGRRCREMARGPRNDKVQVQCRTCGASFLGWRVSRYCPGGSCRPRKLRAERCAHCGVDFMQRNAGQRFCSPHCGHEATRVGPVACAGCDLEFIPKRGRRQRYHSRACAFAAMGLQYPLQTGIERTPRKYLLVLTRDDWRCYLCGKDTPPELRATFHPDAPEVDHVIPRSRGGSDDPSNLRCACRACNLKKRDAMPEAA